MFIMLTNRKIILGKVFTPETVTLYIVAESLSPRSDNEMHQFISVMADCHDIYASHSCMLFLSSSALVLFLTSSVASAIVLFPYIAF